MLTVVYPGTFDPFTRGHEDLVRRAASLFDRVVVGIAASDAKRPMFTLEERVAMCREVLADLPNAVVEPFATLLMEFVQSQGARAVLRGLRAVSDFEPRPPVRPLSARASARRAAAGTAPASGRRPARADDRPRGDPSAAG